MLVVVEDVLQRLNQPHPIISIKVVLCLYWLTSFYKALKLSRLPDRAIKAPALLSVLSLIFSLPQTYVRADVLRCSLRFKNVILSFMLQWLLPSSMWKVTYEWIWALRFLTRRVIQRVVAVSLKMAHHFYCYLVCAVIILYAIVLSTITYLWCDNSCFSDLVD